MSKSNTVDGNVVEKINNLAKEQGYYSVNCRFAKHILMALTKDYQWVFARICLNTQLFNHMMSESSSTHPQQPHELLCQLQYITSQPWKTVNITVSTCTLCRRRLLKDTKVSVSFSLFDLCASFIIQVFRRSMTVLIHGQYSNFISLSLSNVRETHANIRSVKLVLFTLTQVLGATFSRKSMDCYTVIPPVLAFLFWTKKC